MLQPSSLVVWYLRHVCRTESKTNAPITTTEKQKKKTFSLLEVPHGSLIWDMWVQSLHYLAFSIAIWKIILFSLSGYMTTIDLSTTGQHQTAENTKQYPISTGTATLELWERDHGSLFWKNHSTSGVPGQKLCVLVLKNHFMNGFQGKLNLLEKELKI